MISNMYPDDKSPSYGVFVKNFVRDMELNGANIDLSVIMGRRSNLFFKVFSYIKFYSSSIYKIIKGDYDVIYVHYIAHSLIPVIFLRCFISKPYILNAHGEDVLLNKRIEKLIEGIGRKTILSSSLIVVPSDHYKNILIKRYNRHKIRVFVSPSGGFNRTIFYPQKKDPHKNSFLVGYVSRIDTGKGWDTLIDAVKILKENSNEIRLELIGLGSQSTILKNKITNLGLDDRVIYLGPKKQEELGDHFRRFDLFVFPTTLDESLGLVGIESMACGTPVVGSNIPSINSYLVNNQNGLLFEPGNSHDLANKILIYKNLTLEEKNIMIESCIQNSRTFSNDVVGMNLHNKISSICE